MKNKKGFGLGINCHHVDCMYCTSNHDDDWWKKYTIMEFMKYNATIEKMISEKDENIERTLNYLQMQTFQLKKGDL